ncbi:MAG TPA: hypothetical protein VMU60_02980 [Syntrophobacteria bacterium]|jgi:hypothetical protein|nr:hypothetical protein [Syntrophobacteria bacterium]
MDAGRDLSSGGKDGERFVRDQPLVPEIPGDEAALIGRDTTLDALNGLAEKERHCAYLAAETLQAAIHDWMVRERVGTTKP